MILSKFSVEGRVAIVTGSGKGLGKGIALGLAEAGADIAVVARTVADIEETAAEIRKLGRKALPVPADVRESEQVDDMVKKMGNEEEGIPPTDLLREKTSSELILSYVFCFPVSMLEQEL